MSKPSCDTCGDPAESRLNSRPVRHFCSPECQRVHWIYELDQAGRDCAARSVRAYSRTGGLVEVYATAGTSTGFSSALSGPAGRPSVRTIGRPFQGADSNSSGTGDRKKNEDRVSLDRGIVSTAGDIGEAGFFSVYDGHGGSETANFLSESGVRRFPGDPGKKANFTDDLLDTYGPGFRKDPTGAANRFRSGVAGTFEGWDRALLEAEIAKASGSTASVALVTQDRLFVAFLGDSQVAFYDGTDVKLTLAHRLLGDRDRGRITKNPESPQTAQEKLSLAEGERVEAKGGANIGGRILGPGPETGDRFVQLETTRSFGDFSLKVDRKVPGYDPAGIVSVAPTVEEFRFPVDLVSYAVLATDGLWAWVSGQVVKIAIVRAEQSDAQDKAQFVHDRLIRRRREINGANARRRGLPVPDDLDDLAIVVLRFPGQPQKRRGLLGRFS
jgi:serine/threonine protein phosphatase PrpC